MDQGPLVTEQIEAGAKIVREFDKQFPLQAAFWLREPEGDWQLVLASDQIGDATVPAAYAEVHRLFRETLTEQDQLWVHPLQVKVRTDQPLIRGIIDLQRRFPASTMSRIRGEAFGGRSVEEAWLYTLPVAIAS
jgi:hypothetical protein